MEIGKTGQTEDSARNEEVQHIIDRMPSHFGFVISSIIAAIFLLMLFFDFKVRYPDVVSGEITVNANAAPIKLMANSYGKLKIGNLHSLDRVEENDLIAYIDNPTPLRNALLADSLLEQYNPMQDNILELNRLLPRNLAMGELNARYYAFLNSLQELENYRHDKLFEKQKKSLELLHKEQVNAIQSSASKIKTASNSLSYIKKFHLRDSILLSRKVLSDADFDKTEISYLSGKDNYETAVGNLILNRQQAQQTIGKIQEIAIQKKEKEKELLLAVISSYNNLKDDLKSWEQKYVFRAPFDGKVQFSKFWTDNQFVQSGEPVFTVVPRNTKAIGQLILPVHGAGKVKTGQEVIVKLEDYPYVEYGSVTGTVKKISLTSNSLKTDKGSVETYLVEVEFPHQLKTNYNTVLDFKFEAKGTADVITNDRKLIERLFDNLRYAIKK